VRTVDAATARRFILGRQGLWPTRRWKGGRGVVECVRYAGRVQVDPLNVVGHSQDLVLLSRIEGYAPALLDAALYRRRSLFEWGGNLCIRPIAEWPFVRSLMRSKILERRWTEFARAHADVIARVLRAVEENGPTPSRGLPAGPARPTYRARHDTGLALYYLWLAGDLAIHRRERGEKYYDLADRLIPERLRSTVTEGEAREHLALEGLRHLGLASTTEIGQIMRNASSQKVSRDLRERWSARWESDRAAVRIRVDGWPGEYWLLSEAEEELGVVHDGGIPTAWGPGPDGTDEEARFLAPLDIVMARQRAQRLFDFEYVWEVYKPVSRRRWGYYVLPVLHGDRLRGRAELRLDRARHQLVLIGFWGETPHDLADPGFARAVGRGMSRLARMNSMARVRIEAKLPRRFRGEILAAAA
jgi:uncharacterized protein